MQMESSNKEELMRLLITGSRENNSYSVPDVCRKMGISYEQILCWAEDDDYQWAHTLEMCRIRCIDNVEMAAMMKRMKFRDALRYIDYRQYATSRYKN